MKIFVLNHDRTPLMPCHPARARKLLNAGKAAVIRMKPFTIILKEQIEADVQPVELRVDPGSKTTGLALVSDNRVIWAANLNHRQNISSLLADRRSLRRGRRGRKTRYRQPRWRNRGRDTIKYENGERVAVRFTNNKSAKNTTGRPSGWIAPSLQSRIDNVYTWARRLKKFAPIHSIAIETVRFDTQKMNSPEISGVEYQQGELLGYEVREYLLEKWGRQCAYCGAKDVPLEVEHIVAKSKGGSNRVSNLTIACRPCNERKGNKPIDEFLADDPTRLKKIKSRLKQSLKDAAVVNSTRYAIGEALKDIGLPLTFWSGGRTKFNRRKGGYKKDHWIDAACVGELGYQVDIPEGFMPMGIKATGYGRRGLIATDKYGFPRKKKDGTIIAPRKPSVTDFSTGDIAKIKGRLIKRIISAKNGGKTICYRDDEGKTKSITYKKCQLIQKGDGYEFS